MDKRLSVKKAWALALFADAETPATVMAMAWLIHFRSDNDGAGVAIANADFVVACGVSEPTVTKCKAWLRDRGYVALELGKRKGAPTTFRMALPTTQMAWVVQPQPETVTPTADYPSHLGTKQPNYPNGLGSESRDYPNGLGSPSPDYPNGFGSSSPHTPKKKHFPKQESLLLTESHQRARVRETEPLPKSTMWANVLNASNAETSRDCWRDDAGLIHVANGFGTSLLADFDGDAKQLDAALKAASGSIGMHAVGVDLKRAVMGQLGKMNFYRIGSDRRYEQSAKRNVGRGRIDAPGGTKAIIDEVLGRKP